MNPELKALLDVAFDGLSAVEDGISHNYISIFGDMMKLMGDAPEALMNFSDLINEFGSLKDPAAQADLLAYVGQKFKGAFSDSKVQAIVAAALVLVVSVEDGYYWVSLYDNSSGISCSNSSNSCFIPSCLVLESSSKSSICNESS